MPACLAHYQFGRDVLSRLGGEARPAVLAHRGEYDCGLQGPDIFFFYKPWRRNAVRDYGSARHGEPALRMFAPMLASAREPAALAYLTGLVCHYALDKWCHPYVLTHSGAARDHQRMEAAFDRDVMEGAGLTKPRYQYLPAAGLDYAAMAPLWPGIGAGTLEACVRAERRAIRLLDRRRFLVACETVLGRRDSLTPLTLPDTVPEEWAAHVRRLRGLYDKALGECPALIRTALASEGKTLGQGLGFDLNFKGAAEGG